MYPIYIYTHLPKMSSGSFCEQNIISIRNKVLREGNHLGDPGVDGRRILKWILKIGMGAWTGLSWLRIGTGGGLL
jgi:hypothetical protein